MTGLRDMGVHFSELGGFALMSPAVVERELAPAVGDDLWGRLAADVTGDDATDRGVIIPVTVDESGHCRIGFRFDPGAEEVVAPAGPLEVVGNRVVMMKLASLLAWDPERSLFALDVPDGWYAVRVVSGRGDEVADLTVTVALSPTAGPVRRTADLDLRLAADGTRRTPGMVSIWTGRFGDEERLWEHVSLERPHRGPAGSVFMQAMGLGWYDQDRSSTVWLRRADGTTSMDLPEGAFAAAVANDLARRPDDDAAVLLYDLDARDLPEPPGLTPLRLLGAYRY
ncbi:hypothetical protein FGG90_02745 [Clavibacter tessellarius]|nr:hypothetical protein [Clavibacter michiganensis]MBT1634192.1 hypothetical protein [Clavibacter michiganensis]UKF33003.1 hypothetical protein FGG90_02745 [Clavibacter michiganensis subsp. tessellarius]